MPWAVGGASRVLSSPANGSAQHAAAVDIASGHAAIQLRYTESSPILVRGPVSGRTYRFSAAQPLQPVDRRDAPSLCETRFFRRA